LADAPGLGSLLALADALVDALAGTLLLADTVASPPLEAHPASANVQTSAADVSHCRVMFPPS